MQKYINTNTQKWAIGKQIDLAIADGATATSATSFYAVKEFSPQNAPEPIMIEDSEGNRSKNTFSIIGNRMYPFSFKGSTDIEKIGRFIYYATGEVTSAQDAATGAYQHTFVPRNNVILPRFTMFYNLGAEDYRRMTNCAISKLSITITESEASFAVEGMGTGEDDTVNSTTSITSLTVTRIAYINGATRFFLSGSPTLTSVKNGDVFDSSSATGITNSVNIGKFMVISADNTAKTVDVIIPERTDGSLDETGLTATGNQIIIAVTPSYATPSNIMLRRHSAVITAADTSGLSSATQNGLRNFTFEIDNQSDVIYEKPKSSDPLEIFAHDIQIKATFTQLLSAASAKIAKNYRDSVTVEGAWRFELEDTSKYLGTSVLYHPLIRMTIPKAKAIATRNGMGSPAELTYDWTLYAFEEQSVTIVLQNTTASYA